MVLSTDGDEGENSAGKKKKKKKKKKGCKPQKYTSALQHITLRLFLTWTETAA